MRCGARICLSRAREARAEPWATCADEAAEPPSHPATAQETHPQGPYNVRVALHTAGPGAVALTAAFDSTSKSATTINATTGGASTAGRAATRPSCDLAIPAAGSECKCTC